MVAGVNFISVATLPKNLPLLKFMLSHVISSTLVEYIAT